MTRHEEIEMAKKVAKARKAQHKGRPLSPQQQILLRKAAEREKHGKKVGV